MSDVSIKSGVSGSAGTSTSRASGPTDVAAHLVAIEQHAKAQAALAPPLTQQQVADLRRVFVPAAEKRSA